MENVERVECQFQRYRYDETFNVEYRSKGRMSIGCDGVADYVIEPAAIPAGSVSRRKNGSDPFSLKSEEAATFNFTKDEVTRTRGKGGVPEPTFVFEHPLAPFLLNVSRRELTSRFEVKLVSQTPDQIRLELVPRRGEHFDRNFSSVELILNRKGFVPFRCADNRPIREFVDGARPQRREVCVQSERMNRDRHSKLGRETASEWSLACENPGPLVPQPPGPPSPQNNRLNPFSAATRYASAIVG